MVGKFVVELNGVVIFEGENLVEDTPNLQETITFYTGKPCRIIWPEKENKTAAEIRMEAEALIRNPSSDYVDKLLVLLEKAIQLIEELESDGPGQGEEKTSNT